MSVRLTPARAPWLFEPGLQKLLAILSAGGEEARIAGGAVRDALLQRPVDDLDVATTTVPGETVRRAEAAGFRTIPTGIDHGTVTVLVYGQPVEVTTLRADVDTDGRHATVAFGRDWTADAQRRDFTINGLYATAKGEVIDLVGGLADIDKRILRFIGDPEKRIREDYLRILRFFRFFAWYGAGRPDAEGLKACARLKDGLSRLSAERVWSELRKLLSAPDPSRALLWMRQASVLTTILPESEKWGIDAIHGLVAAEQARDWAPDPLLRLAAIVPRDPPRIRAMAERLRMSNAEAERLVAFAAAPDMSSKVRAATLPALLYRGDRQAIVDRLRLAVAGSPVADEAALLAGLLELAQSWEKPVFPVRGDDLIGIGIEPGPAMGETLRRLEDAWVESGFALDRNELLSRAAGLTGQTYH